MNLQLLDYLSSNYAETLTSIMWVDSLSNDNHYTWNLMSPEQASNFNERAPNPLIMLAWMCKKLEEITFIGNFLNEIRSMPMFFTRLLLIGYKYPEDNLVAIARLRKNTLKKLEFAHADILYSDSGRQDARKVRFKISYLWGNISAIG